MNKNFLFFTVGQTQNSNVESSDFKKYVGVGTARVLAVNPTKAELKELAGYEPKEEPVYTGTQEVDGKNVPYVRVAFLLKVDPEDNNGAEFTYTLNYFIRKQYRKGTQSGKYQVVDNYANFAWGDEETVKNNKPILYSNGPAKIIGNYMPVYVGYPALLNFIKEYLCVGSTGETNGFDYINGSWVEKTGDKLEACVIGFTKEEIDAWFNGNVSAIKEAIAYQPTNKVKGVFGVRTNSENGNEYQDMYPRVVRNKKNANITAIENEINDSRNNGGLNNRVYEFTPIHEYVVTPTDLTEDTGNPFDAPMSADPWA